MEYGSSEKSTGSSVYADKFRSTRKATLEIAGSFNENSDGKLHHRNLHLLRILNDGRLSVDVTEAYAVRKDFEPSMVNAQLYRKEKDPYIAMCFANPNDR